MSYPQWGPWATVFFEVPVFGIPWVNLVTEFSKWAAVTLTFFSGFVYLWRNRNIYLKDM